MSANSSITVCAIVFLFFLVICIFVALYYNPSPVEVVKVTCPKSTTDLLAERVKSRNSPVKCSMTPQNRAATLGFDDSNNNDPWAALDRVDNERNIKNHTSL